MTSWHDGLSFSGLASSSWWDRHYSEAPKPTLLIDLGVVEEARLKEALAIFGSQREDALVSAIRGRALLITTEAEASLLRERGFEFKEVMRDEDLLTLFRRGIYGPTMTMPEAYHTYDEILNVVRFAGIPPP